MDYERLVVRIVATNGDNLEENNLMGVIEDKEAEFGTGFFIDKNKIMTAYHVISSYFDINDCIFINPINLGINRVIKAKVVTKREESSVAILEIDEEFEIEPVKFTEGYRIKPGVDEWESFGHPKSRWKKGHIQTGKIHRKLIKGNSSNVDYDLSLNIDGVKNFSGMSGAPFIVEGKLLGIINEQSEVNGEAIALGAISINLFNNILPEKYLCEYDENEAVLSRLTCRSRVEAFMNEKNTEYFSGRETQLEKLKEWKENGGKCCLIVGNAGVGKSALITSWYQTNKNRLCEVIFIPVNKKHDLDNKINFYEILFQSLSERFLFYEDINNMEYYESKCYEILDNNKESASNIIVVIDGVDEADWSIQKDIYRLKDRVRLICTSRDVIKYKNANWEQFLKFDGSNLIKIKLTNFDNIEDVKKIISKSKVFSNEDEVEAATQKIFEVTKGDVLLIDLIIKTLKEEKTRIEDIDKIPKGYDEFFIDVLDDDDEMGNKAEFLSILAIAKGPMNLEEIQQVYQQRHSNELLNENKIFGKKTRRIIHKINGRYSFAHPKLGEYLIEEYYNGTSYKVIYQREFVEWGDSFLEEEKYSEYLIKNYTKHLLEGNNFDKAMRILNKKWRKMHGTSIHRYVYYKQDMDNIKRIFANELNLGKLSLREYCELSFEIALISATFNSMKLSSINPVLISEAFKSGKVSNDYLENAKEGDMDLQSKLEISVSENGNATEYYKEIKTESTENQFNCWLILMKHPKIDINRYAAEEAEKLIYNSKEGVKNFEEKRNWEVIINRIWKYILIDKSKKLANFAVENLDKLKDNIHKYYMKLEFNQVLEVEYRESELLNDLRKCAKNFFEITQFVELIDKLEEKYRNQVIRKILNYYLQYLRQCSIDSMAKKITIKRLIIIISTFLNREANARSALDNLIDMYPRSYFVCDALITGVKYVESNIKKDYIEIVYRELSKLTTGDQKVKLYKKLLYYTDDKEEKEKILELYISAGEQIDDYKTYLDFKRKIMLQYGSEIELISFLDESKKIYTEKNNINGMFKNLNQLTTSTFRNFNKKCLDEMIDLIKLEYKGLILDYRYEKLLNVAKNLNYRYKEISQMSLRYYTMNISNLNFTGIYNGMKFLVNNDKVELGKSLYSYIINKMPNDDNQYLGAIRFINEVEIDIKEKLVDFVDSNIHRKGVRKENIQFVAELYKLTQSKKYYDYVTNRFKELNKFEKLKLYIKLLGEEQVLKDSEKILDDLLDINKSQLDFDTFSLKCIFEKKESDEIKNDLIEWIQTKNRDEVKLIIRKMQKNELFKGNYELIYNIAQQFDVLAELGPEILKYKSLNEIQIFDIYIQALSSSSRSYLGYLNLENLLYINELDYKAVLSITDKIYGIWN